MSSSMSTTPISNTYNSFAVTKAILALYMLSFAIYAGYTADQNQPHDDSSGLFVASYVICILQCIIYLCGFFYIISLKSSNNYSSDSSDNSNYRDIIPLCLNIYWPVVYYNYTVSEKYDEYALVKTVEFYTLMGLFILGLCMVCVWWWRTVTPRTPSTKPNISEPTNPDSNV